MAAYLDYNATCPVRPEAAAAVTAALSLNGNASSVHTNGRKARAVIESARESLAERLSVAPSGVIFTSGASEANAQAVAGLKPRRVLASAVEHPSILKAADALIPVDGEGLIDLDALDRALCESAPALVALMLANNETGVIQPVAEAARIAHAHGAWLHCDAVQAFSKIPFDLARLGADSVSLSAHKLGGPQGVGALVLAEGDATFAPLIRGGGQERSRRAGTENLPGIAGFAAAVGAGFEAGPVERLRDLLERELAQSVPEVVFFGRKAARLPNTSCFALPGLAAETAVMALDLDGVMVSSGSACSSGRVEESHVLKAMGAGPLARSALRASLGWASREEDVARLIEVFSRLARSHRARRAA